MYELAKEHREKNQNAVALGRLGGRAGRGQSKARSTEQARAAVMVRWNKQRSEKNHSNKHKTL